MARATSIFILTNPIGCPVLAKTVKYEMRNILKDMLIEKVDFEGYKLWRLSDTSVKMGYIELDLKLFITPENSVEPHI